MAITCGGWPGRRRLTTFRGPRSRAISPGRLPASGARAAVYCSAARGACSQGGRIAEIKIQARRRPEANGEIKVQICDLPAGVTATPASIAGGAVAATVKLNVDPDAGAAAVNLVAAGETTIGKNPYTATSPAFSLAVSEVPGFTLAIEPAELSASQDDKKKVPFTAKIARRGGFDGPVELQWVFPGGNLGGGPK